MNSAELSHLECNLIDLGKIVIKCQLIEHHLASILALMRHDSSNSSSDTMQLIADCRAKTLEQLINELKLSGHPVFTESFVGDLRIFCKSRNLIIHNLTLSTNFHDAFFTKPDHLKPYLYTFSGLIKILLDIYNTTSMSVFPEIAGNKPRESSQPYPFTPEEHNSLIRHFMSEKWEAKGKKLKSESGPRG